MRNVIYKICEKLRGFSSETEYFEVLQVEKDVLGHYIITVRVVEEIEETDDESDE